MGYSLGAGAGLRAAIQHPGVVRRLTVVSIPCRREGWFPEVLAAFEQMGRVGFDQMKHSPMYAAWAHVAPDCGAFPTLMDKTGELQRRPYDWTDQVRGLTMPTLLVYGDADSIAVSHAAEFFALLGGGLRDAGCDGSGRSEARLAILPGANALRHLSVSSAGSSSQWVLRAGDSGLSVRVVPDRRIAMAL